MSGFTRREFLQTSCASAAYLSLADGRPLFSGDDEIRGAVVGIRSRGRAHIEALRALKGVRVVALCDVDRTFLGRESAAFKKRGEEVATFTDIRRLLEQKNIDVVAVATPNHWHALMAIWCCQAGKDVYLEKPVSHNVWEGRQIVRAAEKYGRIVQTGTQSRSSPSIQDAFNWVQSGKLGAITLARGLCYKPRKSIGRVGKAQTPPSSVDYDLWTGPAEMRPLRRKRLHYDWHWDTNTGNGDIGNQGIHQMDLARWALGETTMAPRVFSVGGRLGYTDDGDTPNSQVTVHDYKRAPLIFEVRGLPQNKASQEAKWKMDTLNGVGIGVIVECAEGRLIVPSYSDARAEVDGKVVKVWKGGQNHFANFIDAVRQRNGSVLKAPIEGGHLSSALCHLGNISNAIGADLSLEEGRKLLGEHAPLRESCERLFEHLEANAVDLRKTPLRFGQWLDIDEQSETIRNNDLAQSLMRRNGRSPFQIPEKV